nr:cytokine receptor-like isoform X1 [Vanessa tameamea]
MADLDSRKRTKCSSGSRNGPQFRSWIWCILIKCFISLPCIFSKCLGVDITVAVYPQGDITVPYGNPLEIFCIAENYSSNDIEFSLAGKHLESEIVNSTTRRLYIKKPEKQVNSYYCRNNKTGKICVARVLVESPPADVMDFNCLSKNLDILNCSWTSPESYSNVNYSVTFSVNGNFVKSPRIAEKVDNTFTRYCLWNTSSQPRYRQQEEEQFFHLIACNVFGCNKQNFTIDHYSIVKPDPPIDLRVVKNGTHSVVLKWSVPNNIVDLLRCGVDHIIEYQIAKIDNTTQFHRVDASYLPPKNKTYRFQLTNLPYAHMQYEVRVYIKSKKAVKREFWSEFEYTVFCTASERPKRPPDMIAGAFHQATYENKRVVYVYWKQLEEYEEAGANFTYKVLVSQGNKTETVFPEKNKSLSYVILNASLDALDVTVWSFNMNGSSTNSSHLYIPPEKDTRYLKLTSFTKLAYENGTYELSWVGIKDIDNYTLFWCQHNTTKICAGRMDFAVLDPKKNNHVIDLPREYRYQFAISANNGTKTSGMVWAKCDISKDGVVMYGFPVHLNYDVPGKSYVTLRWVMDCALQDGIITGYNISYCPIVQTSSYCDKSVENRHIFIPNPKQMDVTIKNLLPFRTYQFTFALKTIYGQKNIENATAVLTTSEDTPTNPINVQILDVKNTSLTISWDPPIQRNGNIGKYVIYNYDKEFYVDKVSETDTSRREVTLTGLQGYTNYSLTVQACNVPIGLCSKIGYNDAIFVRTRIGSPSRLKAPTVKNNPEKLTWEKPDNPGGTVDQYQIRRVIDDLEPEIINTTGLEVLLTHCEGVVSTETYEVRAVNFDYDLYHGVLSDGNVTLPERAKNESVNEYPGPWSEPSTVACRSRDGLTMILIFMAIFALIGIIYGSIKLYKKYRKMEDIKPVLPNGLGIPEKDISKYTFGGWNPTNKEEKPSSDEMLLLPNSKTTVSSPDLKQKDENCGASDQTDSTALSDSSRGPVDRQVSTSDDGSNSSFHIEPEPIKANEVDNNEIQEGDSSTIDTESSRENSPYLSDKSFKKNSTTGYVQPVVNSASGYVQSAPAPIKGPLTKSTPTPASTSYVMAGLPPPIFTTSAPSQVPNPPAPSSGYVLPEEVQARSMVNFSKLGSAPPKLFGPESLPTMPTLPPPAKHCADNSYIQLQSLDSLPSLKTTVRNPVPLKPSASSGYVSPEDVVINKHLNNMLSAGQLAEEPAILDPTMSPDAYCRFSWSTDPANDNLHTLLAESPTRTTKN